MEGARGPHESPPDDTVTFLPPPRPTTPLAETALYRPGALVAVIFLVPPAASALVLASLEWRMRGAPAWLPLLLLLWIPILLAGWGALRGVRLTRDELAFARPLQAWRVIPLDTIERLESHGLRLTLVAASGRRVSFAPALLRRGAQLRRRLLLSLPMQTLNSAAREEARRLLDGVAISEIDVAADALTVRPPRWMVGLALALACMLAVGAVVSVMAVAPWLALASGALALLALVALLWLAQEVFISDRGVIARFFLLRVTWAVTWKELFAIGRAPGEVALILRGRHSLICAGPGLFDERDARRMRELVSQYALEHTTPVAPRNRR